jgi:hypothetical protein
MHRINTIYVCSVSLLLMASLAGCQAGDSHTDRVPVPDPINVALPFVEAVHIPAQIHAGQPFSITLDISCDLNPLALRSPERPFPAEDHWDGAQYNSTGGLEYSATLKPFRDLTQASDSLPVQASVTYDLGPFPTGGHKLFYLSAAAREQGGTIVHYDRQQHGEMEDVSGYYREVEFKVLP